MIKPSIESVGGPKRGRSNWKRGLSERACLHLLFITNQLLSLSLLLLVWSNSLFGRHPIPFSVVTEYNCTVVHWQIDKSIFHFFAFHSQQCSIVTQIQRKHKALVVLVVLLGWVIRRCVHSILFSGGYLVACCCRFWWILSAPSSNTLFLLMIFILLCSFHPGCLKSAQWWQWQQKRQV